LWKQIEKYNNFWSALIAQTQNALILLAMYSKDQNVSVAVETRSSVMSSSFLSSSLSHISLFSLSSDSILSMTSSLSLSLTLITWFIIEKIKNAVSFDMSFLSHSFCQYNSLCIFCAIWLIVARVYFHQFLNFRESESWMIYISYETHELFMYQFLHLLTTFLDCWFEYWWEWLSEKILFFFSFFLSNDS